MTPAPLNPGDPVTFVAPTSNALTPTVEARHATVDGFFSPFGRVQIVEPDGQKWFIDNDDGPAVEGVHWIRGHHALDSEPVRAMLAARALR